MTSSSIAGGALLDTIIGSPIKEIQEKAKKAYQDPKFQRALEIAGRQSFFELYAVYLIPLCVVSIFLLIYYLYYSNYIAGKTPEQVAEAQTIFSSIVAVMGLCFAISGIYSMPFITKGAFQRTTNKYAQGWLYYRTGIAPPNLQFSDGSYSDKNGTVRGMPLTNPES